jgi:hypothetical protein
MKDITTGTKVDDDLAKHHLDGIEPKTEDDYLLEQKRRHQAHWCSSTINYLFNLLLYSHQDKFVAAVERHGHCLNLDTPRDGASLIRIADSKGFKEATKVLLEKGASPLRTTYGVADATAGSWIYQGKGTPAMPRER